MSSGKKEKSSSDKPARKKKDRASEVANTFEWLITAFILAFVFRAFVMEAFRIPTGSMADTLKGAHFRLRCRQCGYKYNYGFVPRNYGFPEDYVPLSEDLRSYPTTRCPSCGNYRRIPRKTPVANGDRILVLKCIYQFFEPKRWDVIVFKNPPEPEINYIKRLIGLPGEKVQIIDGDIYIDGQISRKPPKVQNELWMPVYDNDYQPVNRFEPTFNHHPWEQPFKTGSFSRWEIDKDSPTLFRLDSPADQINTMTYSSTIGNNFRATYAYDEVERYDYMPYCSDLMVRFYANPLDSEGLIGIELSKYETHYKAWVDLTGEMVITKKEKNGKITKKAQEIEPPTINKSALVKFANVDHQLVFQFGGEKLTWDLGSSPEAAGPRETKIEPQVRIFGSGKLTLSHVAIFRDIHYTAAKYANGPKHGRAIDKPFTLGEDEFFVLGDNSPNSEDGRLWTRQGLANKGLPPYRVGIVPRDYLVGKALCVYWPSGFKFPWPKSLKAFLLHNSENSPVFRVVYAIVSWNWIPNIEQRFIYGGSNDNP